MHATCRAPAALCRSASAPPDPKAFLLKGEGEKIRAAKLSAAARSGSPGGCTSPTAASAGSKRIDMEPLPSPPKAGATNVRTNPPNTTFRKFYERGDLPISVDHKSFKNTIKWKVRPAVNVACRISVLGLCCRKSLQERRQKCAEGTVVRQQQPGGLRLSPANALLGGRKRQILRAHISTQQQAGSEAAMNHEPRCP